MGGGWIIWCIKCIFLNTIKLMWLDVKHDDFNRNSMQLRLKTLLQM